MTVAVLESPRNSPATVNRIKVPRARPANTAMVLPRRRDLPGTWSCVDVEFIILKLSEPNSNTVQSTRRLGQINWRPSPSELRESS